MAAVTKKGKGFVLYNSEDGASAQYMPLEPAWLRSLLGDDFFAKVYGVNLRGDDASNVVLEDLKGLPQLRALYLDQTKFTDSELGNLKRLRHLQQLGLDRTQIGDAALENFKGLTELNVLFLRFTKVTDEGVKDLQQALPNCTIYH